MGYTAPKMSFQKIQKWQCWLDQIILLSFKGISICRQESHKLQQKETSSLSRGGSIWWGLGRKWPSDPGGQLNVWFVANSLLGCIRKSGFCGLRKVTLPLCSWFVKYFWSTVLCPGFASSRHGLETVQWRTTKVITFADLYQETESPVVWWEAETTGSV